MCRDGLADLNSEGENPFLTRIVYMCLLADVLHRQESWDEAEQWNRNLVATDHEILGDYHPYALSDAGSLADLLWPHQGKPVEEEKMLRELLPRMLKVLGRKYPSTLKCMHSLGQLLFNGSNFDDVIQIFRESILFGRKKEGLSQDSQNGS